MMAGQGVIHFCKRVEVVDECIDFKDIQVNKKRWVLLNYPSLVDSNKAKMTPEDFYDFAFSTMTVDYDKMYRDMLPLKELMDKTDKVRIKGPNTDLSF